MEVDNPAKELHALWILDPKLLVSPIVKIWYFSISLERVELSDSAAHPNNLIIVDD